MAAQAEFNPKEFRDALSTFTTGVTIITTRAADGSPIGITANSFNSVSLNPPLVLWSLAKSAYSLDAFSTTQNWNVHVLSVEQEALSGRFASVGKDKFSNIELDRGINDIPLLHNCTARFQCRTTFMYEGGDHVIFVGEVLDFDKSSLPPLAFQSGQYALTARKPREGVRLSQIEQVAPECAYTEDLLGYLAGRAHFQLVAYLRSLLQNHKLDEHTFFVLSVLSVQDHLTREQINRFVAYTGYEVTRSMLDSLQEQGYIVVDQSADEPRFILTPAGRQISLEHIALAKAVEQEAAEKLGMGDIQALKILLKRLIHATDPGVPDLWSTEAPGTLPT